MNESRFLTRHTGLMAISLSALLFSGCSTWDELMGKEESVDYKSTVKGDPLSVPPDLTQVSANTRYRAPEGVTTFSQYAEEQQRASQLTDADRVLPQAEGIEVKRDGDLRWLVVNRPAEDIYPDVIEFWGDNGFTIANQDPRTGIIQTDWAENRAKIPEGWLRKMLGAVIDQVFDSGERERFRTRLERVDGRTEIYISHQHMVEQPTVDQAAFKWVYEKEDPGLNAAMLARLMIYLGTDVERAKDLVAQAEEDPRGPQISALEGDTALQLNEPFDHAWRRVGVAIDSAGFSVEDRDRSTGDYYIRYLDTDTGQKIEQQNFIGRLFRKRATSEAAHLRIHVEQAGGQSHVTVLNEAGQQQTDETAQRILTVLYDRMGGR